MMPQQVGVQPSGGNEGKCQECQYANYNILLTHQHQSHDLLMTQKLANCTNETIHQNKLESQKNELGGSLVILTLSCIDDQCAVHF